MTIGERPLTIDTERVRLVAGTLRIERAAAEGSRSLAAVLGAEVPAAWPPPLAADTLGYWAPHLRDDPTMHGWTTWYLLLRRPDELPLLIGMTGFKGKPDARHSVEIGYGLLEAWHRQGFATEAVSALLEHAFADERVRLVVAHTFPELVASIGVLTKTGFTQVGTGDEPGTIRFERGRD